MNINILNKVSEQIRQCREKYGNYASFSEAMSILREEFEELWAEYKRKQLDFERIEEETNRMKIICQLIIIDFGIVTEYYYWSAKPM